MKNSVSYPCHTVAYGCYVYIVALAFMLFNPQTSYSQCVASSGTIEGLVFSDVNNNGIQNADEKGISGVLVEAFNDKGSLLSSQISTDIGAYSFSNLSDGDKVRLVFTYNSDYASSFLGINNGSSVQFVQVPTCSVRLGLISDLDACNSDTEIVTTCFVQGEITRNTSDATIVGIKYGFNSASPPRKLATHGETGSIWGIAWKNSTKEIFSSAFVKQYAGLTAAGHGAIFSTKIIGSSFSTSVFTTLTTLGLEAGTLSVTDVVDCNYGAQVGKIGLGSLVVSEDEKYLYTVNLYNNTLVKIPTVNPTASNVSTYKIPGIHGFALKFYNNQLYVGVTNPGKIAQVYTFDNKTGDFTLIFETNVLRGEWYDTPADGIANMQWLTDIDFTDDGNMLLSISDRLGHRYCNSATNRLDEQKPDLLMVWNNNGKWELENNGAAGSLIGSGVGNGQGPGGGEFFGDDYWVTNPLYHSEIAIGSIFVMPGTNSVVAAVFDPEINAYSGGLHRYSTINGKKEGSKELYTRDISVAFGKATGFGDIIAVCGLPEVEIGNYVWMDTNENGLQDAAEQGVANITLHLYDESCNLIGTTTTDDAGNYVFNTSNVTGGIQRNTTYYVGFDDKYHENTSIVLDGQYFNMTTVDESQSELNSNISNGTTQCGSELITVNVGHTDHSFDIGLVPAGGCSMKLVKSMVSDKAISINDIVVFEISVTNTGGNVLKGVTIEDKLPRGYVFVPELNAGWTENNGTMTKTLTGDWKPNTSLSTTINLKFDETVVNLAFTNTASAISYIDNNDIVVADIMNCATSINDVIDTAIPAVCDLALVHKVDTDRIYTPDTDVTFVTTVCNQGTIESTGFEITNYLNEEFDFDPALNKDWTISADLKFITYTESKSLLPGECRNYSLTYTILDDVLVSQIVNYAEISKGGCVGTPEGFDFDSTPNNISNDDKGGQPNTATDNMMDDHGSIDEDDQDPATVNLDIIDLSLVKTIANRRASAGDVIVFNLTVKNEGNVPVSRATLVDYIPTETDLVDPSWDLVDGNAQKTISFPGNLQPGQSFVTQCSLKIHLNVRHPATITNTAEIVEMFDQFNRNVSRFDIDSTPDNIRDNDINENTKDLGEDDISTAYVVLICPAEYEPCSNCRAATTPTNGQFELFLKIASQADEEWYVESSVGLYDFASAFPPAAPTLLANGFLLEELTHDHDGHSYYLLQAVHLDGQGFSVRFRNKFGDLEQVVAAPTTCNFDDISVVGPRSLCVGALADYKASTTVKDAEYVWSIDGIEQVGQDTENLTIDWTGYSVGSHTVTVNATPGCIAPAEVNVVLGIADLSEIACIGDFNVSLDDNCSVQITPSMLAAGLLNPTSPYVVMLTDIHGNPIPDATITGAHAGTKVMAKLIEGCGGNSCWSTISVEDKIAPISICQDISLPCYKVDEYVGPFESDNCDGAISNVIVSENITPLSCNDDYIKFIDRVYQATDQYGNKSALCTMRISVERPDLSLLKFPHSRTLLNDSVLVCNSYPKDEFGRPSTDFTGVPTLAGISLYPSFAPICNLLAGYTDTEISNIGCIRKIMRTWSVYENHCSNFNVITFTQVLEITDIVAPVITPMPNITVSAASHGLCEAKVTLPLATVMDSCSAVVEVDVTYPGGFVDNQVVPATVALPVGAHQITYTAYDACGNSSQITYTVTVQDKTPPTVICKGIVVVGLNSLGEAYLYPQNLNDGSFDGCGIDSMKVARMVDSGLIPDGDFASSVDFDCDDAGESIMVALRVWDSSGNSNSCMVSVEVQDKYAPVITCPKPVTIDCSEVYTGMDLTKYGTATAFDACGADVIELAPEFQLNSCRVGYIKRTFVASDGTASASCTQMITVENNDTFDPLKDIEESIDFEVFNTCSVSDLAPENLVGLRGYPVLHQTACSMAAASYSDDTYTFVTGACYKIVRNWTVIDWCEMQVQGSAYVPYTFQQVIKVNNTVPPFFTDALKVLDTVYTESGNCDNAEVAFTAQGDDLCTPSNQLRWQYALDINNDGQDIIKNSGIGDQIVFQATLPVGYHKIQFSFEDACGNIVTKDKFVFIANNDGPKASCLESISVSINPMDTNDDGKADIEMGCIIARTLNASSSHPCELPLTYSFSSDILDTVKCFNCFDVAFDVDVELWVTDSNGNTDVCIVTVDVQDNNDSDLCEHICDENMPTAGIELDDEENEEVCANSPVTLTATGGTAYLWNTGETTASITVVPSITTTYSVVVSNNFGCTAIAEQVITVNPNPTPVIVGDTICIGQTATVTANGGGTYLWNTGATTSALSDNPTINTTYTVTVTNANGCTATNSSTVVVNSLPTAGITGDTNICINETTSLTATGGSSYLWSTGATSGVINESPIITTTYTVTVTNTNGCTDTKSIVVNVNGISINVEIDGNDDICAGASTSLTASGASTYVWSNGDITSTISVTPAVTTTYTVTATDTNGCTATTNLTVNVNPLPTIVIEGDNIICIGESTILTASGASSYIWSTGDTTSAITVSPNATTIYEVTATDANGCVNVASRTVAVNLVASVDITGNDVICNGTSTTITADVTEGSVYLWSNGQTTSSLTVSPSSTTTYTVTVTNSNGCTGTNDQLVTVNPTPTPVISGDENICLGESTTLTASGAGTGFYLWNTGATTPSITVSPIANTTYTVTITDANGCVANTSATVSVDPGTLTCTTQDITIYLDVNGEVSIAPDDVSTGSTGACTNITASVVPNFFACNDVGDVTVTLTVTNTNNNETLTCTAVVTVADTIAPTLACPPNVTVNCDDFDPNAPLTIFGVATATDNCPNELEIDTLSIFNLNDCNVGEITRTFTATDFAGNSVQCVQLISVVNNNPISIADITFPADITVSNCDGISTDITGEATVNTSNADCSNVSISFADDLPIDDLLCADTILRTWTVIDSCQLSTGTTSGIFTLVQNIIVQVEQPIITGPLDTILYVDPATCQASLSGVFHSVSGCNLTIGNNINSNADFDLSGLFDAGITSVVLTAVEGCSSLSATYNFNVSVIDTTSTNLACRKTFPVIQDLDPPSVRDNVMNHAIIEVSCDDDLNIIPSYSKTNINDTVRTYFCADVIIDFPIKVFFWSNGVVIDSCSSLATPTDPNGICSNLIIVGGNVVTETSQKVSGVNVNLLGSNMPANVTNVEGRYRFPEMEAGGEYDLVPTKNDNPLAGVSTLDLIFMQRHVLGTDLLNSPYKMIAADINRDNKVSAADLVQLRKMILGIYDEFPNNTSWRMVDAGFEFPDVTNPFITPFPEKYHIPALTTSMGVNWIGVKTGDVNSSFVASLDNKSAASRSADNGFIIEDIITSQGKNIIPVIASRSQTIEGFQTVIRLPYTTDVTLESGVLPIQDYHYNFQNGYLVISWNDTKAAVINEGEELFTIHISTSKNAAISSQMAVDQTILTSEIYSNPKDVKKLGLIFVRSAKNTFEVWGNSPNPWNQETSINFYLPAAGDVVLKVRDITGRLVFTTTNGYQRGENTIFLTKEQVGATGLLLYELTFADEVKTLKMLNIK